MCSRRSLAALAWTARRSSPAKLRIEGLFEPIGNVPLAEFETVRTESTAYWYAGTVSPFALAQMRSPEDNCLSDPGVASHQSFLRGRIIHMQGSRRILYPFLAALEGTPVPYADLLQAGRDFASVLVAHGTQITVCSDGPWAGVWDLERLTDDEAIAWGMWIAAEVRRL